MPQTREIGVGLLGFGNVGAGVVRLLQENAQAISARLGARISIKGIAVRDPTKARLAEIDGGLVTTDAQKVIDDPRVQIVCEVMGGEEPARGYMLRAFETGKPVVTANKLLVARHGEALFSAAEKAGVDLFYEASVCGGVPVIRALREGLASDRIQSLYGIVNGTSNFVLTLMKDQGMAFDKAVALAQAEGYAEADPAMDVDGVDAAHKLAILASLSFGASVAPDKIHVEGIRHLTPIDFDYAERFGYVVKPLGIARDHDDGIEVRVHPTMIPRSWLLSSVDGVNNAVFVNSYALGRSMYYGRGAGMMPTAMAIVSDTIEVARNLLAEAAGAVPTRSHRRSSSRPVRDMGSLTCRYYLRFCVMDRPGVLASLARVLGEHDVSISQVHQENREPDRPATVVVLTHTAKERDVQAALAELAGLSVLGQDQAARPPADGYGARGAAVNVPQSILVEPARVIRVAE